jgi:hypothetical protein
LARGHLRGVEVRSDEVLLPDAFALDRMMRQALPSTDRFTYISVLEAVCPVRQCPLTLAGGIPLSFDHAHLTAEGSAYVMGRVVPLLGLK